MMFLHTLRLAGDLSFYYAFAGFFAASFGGTPMPLVLVWPPSALVWPPALRAAVPSAPLLRP